MRRFVLLTAVAAPLVAFAAPASAAASAPATPMHYACLAISACGSGSTGSPYLDRGGNGIFATTNTTSYYGKFTLIDEVNHRR